MYAVVYGMLRVMVFLMRIIFLSSLALMAACLVSGAVRADTKKFTEAELKLPGKKGACFTLRQPRDKNGGTVVENMPKVKVLEHFK